jgi:hypothetical protein
MNFSSNIRESTVRWPLPRSKKLGLLPSSHYENMPYRCGSLSEGLSYSSGSDIRTRELALRLGTEWCGGQRGRRPQK